jgi:hypothetical protein
MIHILIHKSFAFWGSIHIKVWNKLPEPQVFPIHVIKTYMRRGHTPPVILNLDTRRRYVIKLTPQTFYPCERTPVPIEDETGQVPRAGLGNSGEEDTLLLLPGFKPLCYSDSVYLSHSSVLDNLLHFNYFTVVSKLRTLLY